MSICGRGGTSRPPSTARVFATNRPYIRDHAGGVFLRFSKGSADVATGIVKWFNATKGYGFIQPDGGGKDVFVHISAVEKAGFTGLAEGAKVSYEIVSDRGKESAGNLRL